MWIAIPIALVGYSLLYAGLKGVHPWCPFLQAFGAPCPSPPGSTSATLTAFDSPAGAPAPTTGGTPPSGVGLTPATIAFEAAVAAAFPTLQSEGDFNCRYIAGTTTWSQHAWGNAVDYRCPDKATEDRFDAWRTANTAKYHIAHALSDEPSALLTHTDFDPQGTGTPPCAGKLV